MSCRPRSAPETEQDMRTAMRRLVEATGFGSGILHAEWITDGERAGPDRGAPAGVRATA